MGSATAASALLALADPATVGPLAQAMQQVGLVSTLAFDAEQVRARLRGQPLDIAVVLLDAEIATGVDSDLVATIDRHTRAAILLLRPDADADRADDEHTMPRDAPVELIAARAHALVLANRGHQTPLVLRWGDLRVYPTARDAYIGRTRLDLTPSQFAVLAALVGAGGATVEMEQIASSIYGHGHPLDGQRVRAHIVRLRRAIRAVRPQVAELLVTVRSKGYRLLPPEELR
ncbi:MAG TPA: winged helix-turn-helix domain-containing protein [Mycobacteriales bacterium]